MKNIFPFLFALVWLQTLAQPNNTTINKVGANVNAFIPSNWKLIYQAKGDLNKDHIADRVIIIQNTNPKNRIKNDGLGSKELNVNPRILLVLLKDKNGYRLVAQNQKFIPAENDTVTTCLTDPLQETGAISIKKGTLILSYQYWLSCGS